MKNLSKTMAKKEIKKIGIVAMPNISVGGGFPRVTRDLIAALNSLGKEVFLLTPYKLDKKIIEEMHGPIALNGVYHPSSFKKKLIFDTYFSRRFLISEFKRMARDVDLIIDMDGGILHKYLPKNFDNSKYIVWRISGTDADIDSAMSTENISMKRKIKNFLKKNLFYQPAPTRNHKIYPLDEWTGNEVTKKWGIVPETHYVYPGIRVEEFQKKVKKKNQVIIFGRIGPEKRIEESLRIFALGSKKHPNYSLVIFGGITVDSPTYIKYLKKIAKELGVANRVTFIGGPSFEKLKNILLESKVLIDAQRDVSLTMTAIEALSAGNVILSYKNAGTYIEVLENGKHGFGFFNVEEGSKELSKILDRLKAGNLLSKSSRNRAQYYSLKNFDRRVKEMVLKHID